MAKAFYSEPGLHVDIYDVSVGEGFSQTGDVDFYRSVAAEVGGPVLELGCGTGRVAWPMAADGFEVVGLDRSTAMLDKARSKADRFPGADAKFVEGDMSDFDVGSEFRLVIIAFRSFQVLLTVEAQRSALTCIHRHLQPDGKLVVDVFDPRLEFLIPGASIDQSGVFAHPDRGTTVSFETIERDLDPLSQVMREVWRFVETDDAGRTVRQEDEVLEIRWGYRFEMRHLFELAGFRIEAEYSDFRRHPPAYGGEQVWVLTPAG